jgi:hypothetical protein
MDREPEMPETLHCITHTALDNKDALTHMRDLTLRSSDLINKTYSYIQDWISTQNQKKSSWILNHNSIMPGICVTTTQFDHNGML